MLPKLLSLFVALLVLALPVKAQVVINEIHYHPVEEPAFNADGSPVLDLTEDVHEFIEIRNIGANLVDLSGYQFDAGVTYTFPAGTTIAAGGFRVIAKNPARLQTVYGIANVLGPYTGVLSNGGETVRLKDAGGVVVDSVGYSAEFPWAVSADGFGAGSSFLGFSLYTYQYKGRSLQRVSPTAGSNDPANWLASPASPGPTPGSANAVSRAVPKPVVISYNVLQASDESPTVRPSEAVNVSVQFSGTTSLSGVQLEWFVDDVNLFGEARSTITMTDLGNGLWTTAPTTIPGQTARSVVRWRIKANRGDGAGEIVSPRADDPQIAPIGAAGAREAWHGYFVDPARASSRPIYDFFISSASVSTLDTNIGQDPRRVQANGYPRDDPKDGYYPPNANYNPAANYPAAGQPEWDGLVPGVFVRNGIVYDITARYHGSRYQRGAAKNSWKFSFPASKLMDRKQRILVTEKTNSTVLGLALFREAGIPAGYSQFVDFYKNAEAVTQRCEISDADEETVAQYQREQEDLNPQSPPNFTGLGVIYKSKGLDGNEGPYGWANGQPMPATGVWSVLDRYIHSFPTQLNDWRGHLPFKTMIDQVWAARGDAGLLGYPSNYNGQGHVTQTAVTANIANLRAHLAANWDVDKMLTYLAIRNWCSPWDDKFHNHYVYLQADGKWTMVPWDFDNEMAGGSGGDQGYSNSIFAGRKDDTAGAYSNNFRGPNWFKDHFLRAYEAEYKARLFALNNTLLSPTNVAAVAAANGTTVPDATWVANRQASVNFQCGLGSWTAPTQAVNNAPANNTGVVPPANLVTSAYGHTSGNTAGLNAHASTRWEIRRSDGTYRKPVYNVNSTTALTSLPVPFELLEFGRIYYWRATRYDGNGRPSAASAETAFSFGPTPSAVTLINFSDVWKYDYSITATNNAWAQPAFDDSTWASGQGVLAFENQAQIPQQIRTVLPAPGTLTPQGRAYYFRKTFDFPGNPATSTVRIRHLMDDGCVIWINGQRVHRYLLNEQANYAYTDFSNLTPNGDAAYQFADAVTGTANWAYVDPRPFLVQGTNTIAVEVHQTSGSSDIVMGLEMTGTLITTGGNVALNEILADNRNAATNGATKPDYVEIRNNTAADVVLTGWSLTDSVLNPGKYAFPAGTTIPAGGRLVVWCDNAITEPGLHSGFGLSRDGQTVALFQGSNVRDFITFGPQAPDVAIGRVADGVGSWAAIAPSPGSANAAVTLGTTATLKVNEWLANPATGNDWFELHNTGANAVALGGLWLTDTSGNPKTQIPPLSFIAGKGFTRFEADNSEEGANHVDFALSVSGESVILLASNGVTVLDSVTFGAQALGVTQGRLPDGGATITSFPGTASPAESNWVPSTVVINEALANSTLPQVDAIELRNSGAASVNIGGWWLSDDRSQLQKYQIPAGTTIPAGGYVVFNEGQFNTGVNAFSLSSTGDEIILSAVDGGGVLTGTRSQVSFGASAENVSFGRIAVTGGAEFWPLTGRTLGTANAGPVTTPVIINEVHYHPADLNAADNTRDEFVELHNPTTAPVDLSGWRLKNDADFTFPAGTILRPGDYIVVVPFDPVGAPSTLADFRAATGMGALVPVYGPFSPKLSNAGATVELAYPGPLAGLETPYILVDKVVYRDASPWPVAADGTGPTLQRISRTVIGNDAGNWVAASATPGQVNSGQTAITDNDGDGLSNAWEDANGLDKFSAADATMDSDGDGQSNAAEFAAGTGPNNRADVLLAVTMPAGAGQMKVRFSAKAGKTYTIQYKNALTDAQWQRLVDVAAQPGDGLVERTDPAVGLTKRFYRVVTPVVP